MVNQTTIDVANVLRWFFYPVPIFSLTFGYISMANRGVIQIVKRLAEPPGRFSNDVAGPAVAFLCAAFVFYWLLVIAFEQRLFQRLCCRGGDGNDNLE